MQTDTGLLVSSRIPSARTGDVLNLHVKVALLCISMTNFIAVLFKGRLDLPTGFPKKDLHGWAEVEYIFSIQEERLTRQQLRRENVPGP